MRLIRLLVALLLAGAVLPLVTPAATAADGLDASVTPNRGKPGTSVQVVGANWEPGARLQIVTCGALGIGGSASCDLRATYTPIADKKGAFGTVIKLGRPPVPCPCVVHVSAAQSTAAVDVPVTLVGRPTAAPPTPKPAPAGASVVVTSAQLTGWGPWTSLFGAGPARDLVLTVHNTTGSPIAATPLTVASGAAGEGGPTIAEATIGSLAPGEVRTLVVPVTLSPGVAGTRTVSGTVEGGGSFTAETTSYAWGFFVLDALLLAVLLLMLVRRVRRRERPEPAPIGRHSAGAINRGPTATSDGAAAPDATALVPLPVDR